MAERSDAASSARRLSQRATEALLRDALAAVAERPHEVAAILDGFDDPLMAFAPSRKILAANAAAEKLFGYDRHALDGQLTDTLIPTRMRQPDAPAMQPNDTLTTVEIPGLRRDGSEPYLSWTFGATTGTAEAVFVMIVRDRADIEAALEALYASEQRFRLLVEGVRDHAVIMLDADGRIATWNSGAERIKGWRAEEILGRPYESFYTPEDRAAGVPAANLLAAARDGHKHVSGWRMRKDGSRFFADADLWPLFTQDGKLQGFAKITHDLTTKRLAEEAQRKLEAERSARREAEHGRDRLQRLHRAAIALSAATTASEVLSAIIDECRAAVDADGCAVLAVGEDGEALTMLAEYGHTADFTRRYAAVSTETRTPARHAIANREALFFQSADECAASFAAFADMIRVGGFEASAALPLLTRGRVVGVLALRYRKAQVFSLDDRSLLLTLAEMCAQALDRARLYESEMSASRAKDEFLAMLGHELRNPLAPIATAIELMKLRGETHSLRERQVIERQLGHITHLVDDLLDVSRITRGKLELALQPTDIAEVIVRSVEMASPLLEQRSHTLTVNAPRGLVVNADPPRLAQVVANLLTNAAKYTPPKGTIQVEAVEDASHVTIKVRDNGQGIDADLLPRVFDLFTQGRRTFDRAEGGLGIGLALVKSLVAMHKGTVSVTSTVGAGSEFAVRLPLYARTDVAPKETYVRPAQQIAGAGRRVLIVDDNRDFAELLAMSLTSLGYEVSTAADAVDALERMREFSPEAAVLDLGLPVLDGFELARQIRQEFPSHTPRLIAVTGYGQAHDRERSAAAGFSAHLVKPIDMKAMVDALERTS